MDSTPNVAPAAPAVSAPANEPVNPNPAPVAGEAPPAPAAEPAEPKAPSRLQKRIDELTASKYENERRAQEAEARLAAFERQQQHFRQVSQLDASEPAIDQFNDLASYQRAMANWTVQKATALSTAQWEERMQQHQAQQMQVAQQHMARQHQVMRENVMLEEKMAAGAKKYADFQQVVGNPDLPTVRGTPLFDAVMLADNAVDIAYALAKAPHELERLLSIGDPQRIAREVFKLDQKFTGTGATQAPPPPPQRNGSPATGKDLGSMSTAEHVADYRRQKMKRST